MKSEKKNKKILLRKKHEKLKRERGITLIALVITIIVLLILAGVSIAMLTGENGILTKAGDARDKTNRENAREQVQMEVYGSYDDNGNFDMGQLKKNIEKNLHVPDGNINDAEDKNGIEFDLDGVKVHVTESGEVLLEGETAKNPSNPNKPTGDSEQADEPQPGEWDGTVNAPKLGEGMTKVVIDESDGTVKKFEESGAEKWYDYEHQKWANAQTEDGSMWVWIPRFAYKITDKPSTPGDTNAGKIEVKFVDVDTTDMKNVEDFNDYIIHPAFTSDVENGGWRSDIPGFWVAKYEMSMEKYDSSTSEWQHANTTSKTDGNVATSTAEEIAKQTADAKRMVSKPGVSSWRYINIANCYTNSYNYDRDKESHLMKNSEWGAVAYLTHSKYGRNGTEVTQNTSSDYYTAGTSEANATTKKDQSSTGNESGVFDLSGGAYEYVAAYYKDYSSNGEYFTGEGYTPATGEHFAKEAQSNSANKNGSNEYVTAYGGTNSYTPSSDNTKTGDATYEVYVSNHRAWFNDYSCAATKVDPFFERGGDDFDDVEAGIFCSKNTFGFWYSNNSFRVVLVG